MSNWNPIIHGRNWLPNVESWAVTTGGSGGAFNVHATCPTREAAEAARRLLSGECERELASARMLARVVAAKEPEKQHEPDKCLACRCTCDLYPPFYGLSVDGMADDLIYALSGETSKFRRGSLIRHAISRAVNVARDSVKPEPCMKCRDDGFVKGAAQERAKIVAWLRRLLRVPHSAEVLASKIETGEADG